MWLAKILSLSKGALKFITLNSGKIIKQGFTLIAGSLTFITNGLKVPFVQGLGRKLIRLPKALVSRFTPLGLITGGLGALSLGLDLKEVFNENGAFKDRSNGLTKILDELSDYILIEEPDGDVLTLDVINEGIQGATLDNINRYALPAQLPVIDVTALKSVLLLVSTAKGFHEHNIKSIRLVEQWKLLAALNDVVAKVAVDFCVNYESKQFLSKEAKEIWKYSLDLAPLMGVSK